MYDEDTLYRQIKSFADEEILQEVLRNIEILCKINGMILNASK
jgi:hypothetical protein